MVILLEDLVNKSTDEIEKRTLGIRISLLQKGMSSKILKMTFEDILRRRTDALKRDLLPEEYEIVDKKKMTWQSMSDSVQPEDGKMVLDIELLGFIDFLNTTGGKKDVSKKRKVLKKRIKEQSLDLSIAPRDRIENGLHIYYDDLFAALAKSIQQVLGQSENIPRLNKPVNMDR